MARRANITAKFDAQNRRAAEIVLADVQTHGGESAALVVWARAVVERLKSVSLESEAA
jgi:hypothetical protein